MTVMNGVEFLYEKNRLKTFKRWKFSSKHACSAEKMAEAGFIFMGSRSNPDLVICFFCDKELDGWEEDDDPWAEHISHSGHCKFAVRRTAEDDLTVNQFLEISNAYFEKVMTDFFDKKIDLLDKMYTRVKEQLAPN